MGLSTAERMLKIRMIWNQEEATQTTLMEAKEGPELETMLPQLAAMTQSTTTTTARREMEMMGQWRDRQAIMAMNHLKEVAAWDPLKAANGAFGAKMALKHLMAAIVTAAPAFTAMRMLPAEQMMNL